MRDSHLIAEITQTRQLLYKMLYNVDEAYEKIKEGEVEAAELILESIIAFKHLIISQK